MQAGSQLQRQPPGAPTPPTGVQLRGGQVLQRRLHLSMQARERRPHERQPCKV